MATDHDRINAALDAADEAIAAHRALATATDDGGDGEKTSSPFDAAEVAARIRDL